MGPLQTTGEARKGGLQGRIYPYPLSRSCPPPSTLTVYSYGKHINLIFNPSLGPLRVKCFSKKLPKVRVLYVPPPYLINILFINYAFYSVFELKRPTIKIRLFPVQTHVGGGTYGNLSSKSLKYNIHFLYHNQIV